MRLMRRDGCWGGWGQRTSSCAFGRTWEEKGRMKVVDTVVARQVISYRAIMMSHHIGQA